MSMSTRRVGVAGAFVAVMALSGAGFYPLLSGYGSSRTDADESAVTEETEVPQPVVEEPKPAKAASAPAAPAKRRATRWSGGGDVVVGSSRPASSSGGSGSGSTTDRPRVGRGEKLYLVTRIYRDSDGKIRTERYYEVRKDK